MTDGPQQIVFFSAYFWIVLKLRFQHEFKLKYVLSLRPLFRGLFTTVMMMYLRNVYRLSEFGTIAATSFEAPGPAASEEWVFFAFESTPIFLAFCFYAWYPFAKYLGSREEHPKWRAELDDVNKRLFSAELGEDSQEA